MSNIKRDNAYNKSFSDKSSVVPTLQHEKMLFNQLLHDPEFTKMTSKKSMP